MKTHKISKKNIIYGNYIKEILSNYEGFFILGLEHPKKLSLIRTLFKRLNCFIKCCKKKIIYKIINQEVPETHTKNLYLSYSKNAFYPIYLLKGLEKYITVHGFVYEDTFINNPSHIKLIQSSLNETKAGIIKIIYLFKIRLMFKLKLLFKHTSNI